MLPKYKYSKLAEYNTALTPEMISVFKGFLLNENRFRISKAINFTKVCLRNKGIIDLPSDMTFRRYAEQFKKINFGEWVLRRQGEKAFDDLVEPYIERDATLLDVGDVLIADGHTLNFQVINPFTGKPARATLVGFLDWKSTALVGYEIMMSENTQCIASALRNSIMNLGKIPKIVYQDNGKAFRAKYFQNCNFDEEGFNGVYANLGIKSVFAKVRNAKAKVIERFFLEFQEEFEKLMISYTGTSIENKPARLMRGEKLHKEMHKIQTGNRVPTIQEVIKYLDKWLDYHNSKPCPNAREMSIKQVLADCRQRAKQSEDPFNAGNQANSVQKEPIDKNILNDLMMKTETKTIHRNGIKFLHNHYYNDALFGLREPVYIRYSLFDLSKVHEAKQEIYTESPFLVGNVEVDVYFSPSQHALVYGIIPEIRAAKNNIYISMFLISNYQIVQELISAKNRGVEVKLFVEANHAQQQYSKHEKLRQIDIPVKVENWPGKMHAKLAVIDEKTIIAGSTNWTKAGFAYNDENLLIFRNTPDSAKYLVDEFKKSWASIPDKWLHANPKPEGADSPGSCSDGLDNDYNHLIDAEDPACYGVPGAKMPTKENKLRIKPQPR